MHYFGFLIRISIALLLSVGSAHGSNTPFELLHLLPEYKNEHLGQSEALEHQKVEYFDVDRQTQSRLSTKNGKFYLPNGSLFDTSLGTIKKFDGVYTQWGLSVVVMTPGGEIRHALHKVHGALQHSSLVSGQPVAFAGTIRVEQGKLVQVRNWSGHYKTQLFHTVQFLEELQQRGIDLSFVDTRIYLNGKDDYKNMSHQQLVRTIQILPEQPLHHLSEYPWIEPILKQEILKDPSKLDRILFQLANASDRVRDPIALDWISHVILEAGYFPSVEAFKSYWTFPKEHFDRIMPPLLERLLTDENRQEWVDILVEYNKTRINKSDPTVIEQIKQRYQMTPPPTLEPRCQSLLARTRSWFGNWIKKR